MRIHIITIGEPKLAYAKAGWQEYLKRLKHYHDVRVTHIADKHNEPKYLLEAAGRAYKIALTIEGTQLSSPELAGFLEGQMLSHKEIAFLIGGPDGLQAEVLEKCNVQLSFSRLTFPHDLAMVILLESLYRAATISAGQPYHR
ncbi:MAG TPA: 23S rRNA (pseudouridine(1915)-N(3))-methyltransferase RlmH [Candidatus Saccharimonadales bacterium]|nr:23S rRNA (pseudouridine(1915)-N(3))-methyltransferase RlmH [Candidatus Saccharimonadales bacterium]